VCVCVCVCGWVGEKREKVCVVCVRVCVRESVRVCERERVYGVCVCVCVCVWFGEIGLDETCVYVCVCVCVCVRRERKCVWCVCACV